MFAYNTEKESFFVATNASLVITYQDQRLRDQDELNDETMKLVGATLMTGQGDKHSFDANLEYVESINMITSQPADARFAKELFREAVTETTERNERETKAHKRLNAEENFVLDKVSRVFSAQQTIA